MEAGLAGRRVLVTGASGGIGGACARAFAAEVVGHQRWRKVAEPEDVTAQVVVLASDELSGHVTGQVVAVAGGIEGRVVHD